MKKVYKTMDGCEAAAYASYAFTEVAGIYPILRLAKKAKQQKGVA